MAAIDQLIFKNILNALSLNPAQMQISSSDKDRISNTNNLLIHTKCFLLEVQNPFTELIFWKIFTTIPSSNLIGETERETVTCPRLPSEISDQDQGVVWTCLAPHQNPKLSLLHWLCWLSPHHVNPEAVSYSVQWEWFSKSCLGLQPSQHKSWVTKEILRLPGACVSMMQCPTL